MKPIQMIGFAIQRMGMSCLLLTGMLVLSCSSAPEPQPEPSKKEVQQDADRFFKKMEQEEGAQSPSQK